MLPTLEEVRKVTGAVAVGLPTAVDIVGLQGQTQHGQTEDVNPYKGWWETAQGLKVSPDSPLTANDSGYGSASVSPRYDHDCVKSHPRPSSSSPDGFERRFHPNYENSLTNFTPSLRSSTGDTTVDTDPDTPQFSPPMARATATDFGVSHKQTDCAKPQPLTIKQKMKHRILSFFTGNRQH